MYYPKSQIKSNLVTKGNEYRIISTREDYKGFYWANSKGEFFTGKNPKDGPSLELEIINKLDVDPITGEKLIEVLPDSYYVNNLSYNNAKRKSIRNEAPRNPKSSQALPTEEDYKAGKYTKYFVSKTNEIKFIQVDKTEYLKFKNKSPEVNWSLYEPIELEWVIGGDRETAFLTNKASVHSISTKYPGFGSVFKNRYDRFWRAK